MSTIDPADIQAIVVGVEQFALGAGYQLDGVCRDALRFARWLEQTLDVPTDNVHLFLSPLAENRSAVEEACAGLKLVSQPATRAALRALLTGGLTQLKGRLLFVFWSGHGVLSGRERRRLFYADSSNADASTLDVGQLLDRLRSTDLSGLSEQVIVIDACAAWFDDLPEDELACGARSPGEMRQFTLLSTTPGQVGLQHREGGDFASALLEKLEAVPRPDTAIQSASLEALFERTAADLRRHFESLAKAGRAAQLPVDYQWVSWADRRGGFGSTAALEALKTQGLYLEDASQPHLCATQKMRQVSLLERHEVFGGRDDELRALDAFIAGKSTYLYLSASSGMGKSALLANWVRRLESADQTVVYHFISRLDDMADEEFALLNLCEQLAVVHGLSGTLPAGRTPLRALYPNLLKLPPPHRRRVIIVIDGLDEAERWKPNFELFPAALPAGVRVVFSSRELPDQDVVAELRLPQEIVATLPLGQLGPTQIEQLLLGGGEAARNCARDPRFLDAIVKYSGGDPFYLRCLIDDINAATPMVIEDLQRRPKGLTAYLRKWYEDLGSALGPEPMNHVDSVLGILVASKGRLMRADLVSLAGLNDLRLGQTLKSFGRFLVGDEAQGYALCHARFQEFLLTQLASTLGASRARLLQWCQEEARAQSSSGAPLYVVRHLAQHLGDEGRVEDLYTLIDRSWMGQHFQKYTAYEYLLADLELAINAVWRRSPRDPARLAHLHTVRQLTRWDVALYSDLDLATLTMIAEQTRALGIARSRSTPMEQIHSLAAIWHAGPPFLPGMLQEMEKIAQRSKDPRLIDRARGAIAVALAKSGEFDEAVARARTVSDPQMRWQSLQFIADAEIANDRRDRARELLNEAVAVGRSAEPSLHWTERFVESARAQLKASMDPADTIRLALEMAQSASADTYKNISRVCAVVGVMIESGRRDDAVGQLDRLLLGLEEESDLKDARAKMRLSGAYRELGDVVQAELLRSEALQAVRSSSAQFHLDSARAGVAHEARAQGDFELAEDLVLEIEDSYERSLVLHDLVMAYEYKGERERAQAAWNRIDDPGARRQATSFLAWHAAKAGDARRARQMLSENSTTSGYTVTGVSSDATANWMRSAVLGLAYLLICSRDVNAYAKAIEVADRLPASKAAGSAEQLLSVAVVCAESGEARLASDAFERCLERQRAQGTRRLIDSHVAMANGLVRGGLIEEALNVSAGIEDDNLVDQTVGLLSVARTFAKFGRPNEEWRVRELALLTIAQAESWGLTDKARLSRPAIAKLTHVVSQGLYNEEVEPGSGRDQLAVAVELARGIGPDFVIHTLVFMAKMARAEELLRILELADKLGVGKQGKLLERLGKVMFRERVAEGLEDIALRLLAIKWERPGAKMAALAAECWAAQGSPNRINGLLEKVRALTDRYDDRREDEGILGAYASTLAHLGRADEAVALASRLPNASSDFGMLGHDEKLPVMRALIKRGYLAHASQLLATMVSAPDAADVWLANWGEALASASPIYATEARGMFVGAAEVIAWVRPDWSELLDSIAH